MKSYNKLVTSVVIVIGLYTKIYGIKSLAKIKVLTKIKVNILDLEENDKSKRIFYLFNIFI